MGKSTGSAPQAPDPAITIPLQTQANKDTFDYALQGNRYNQVTPTGNQTWTKTPGAFDEAGYNAAMAKYQPYSPSPVAGAPAGFNGISSARGDNGEIEVSQNPIITPGSPAATGSSAGQIAPNKADYTKGDTWTLTNSLSDNQQKLFDTNEASQLSQSQLLQALTNRLSGTLNTPLDYSSMPGLTGSVKSPTLDTSSAGLPNQQLLSGGDNLTNPTYGGINRGALATGVNTGSMTATPDAAIRDRSGALDTELGGYKSALGALDPAAFNAQAADAVYGQSTRYLDPQVKANQQALEARLSEQGFVPGTPGYQKAMEQFQSTNAQSYADARDRATTQGFSVGNQTFGNSQSSIQAQIAAALSGANYGLSNDQSRSTENLNLANFGSGQVQNQFGRDLAGAGLTNSAQAQDFGQQQTLSEQQRQSGIDANMVSQQLFQNAGTTAGFNNAAEQQQFSNRAAELSRGNDTALKQQTADTNAATFGNQARSQAIAEALQQRAQPLNELNAIRSGTQVQLPTGTPQGGAGSVANTDVLGAYNNQYQGQVDAYNAEISSDNSLMGLLGSLGLAGATLFKSDARLKEDITHVGKTPGGHNVYDYRIFGRRERGVLAQEVLAIQPEAVSIDPEDGYYQVDYARIR